MGRSRLHTMLVALALVVTTACGASYHPRPGPRIVEMNGEFFRDGQKFKVGSLGGGAEELVAGNPRALVHARRMQSLERRGWLVYGLGLLTIVAAPIVAASVAGEARTPVFIGVAGLGAGVTVLGFSWQFQGYAARLDAINVYNDDVDAARAASPPVAAPGGPP